MHSPLLLWLPLVLAACEPGRAEPSGDTAADGGATTPADGGQDDGGGTDGGGSDGGGSDGGADGGGATTDGGTADDTGEPTPTPSLTVEEIGDQDPDLDGWLFDPLAMHTIDLTLSPEARAALDASPWDYVEGSVTIDGVPMERVGVRLRGKIGSFRYLSGKPKFKIDFNQYVEDQRFHGLETLSLNNSVVDCSYLKEPIAYRVMRDAGIAASRTSFAWVTVNGATYGLYVLIETPDDRFLARNFEEPDGNLYDGKYVWYADGSYELLDFASGDDHLFQLEEGTDVGHADITAVSEAVAAWWGTGRFEEQLSTLVDMEQLHRVLAAEQWVGHNDGYAMNTNNYRVYFDPLDGRMRMVPWDFDYSFLNDWEWGMSWSSPRGTLASGCWRDEHCHAAQAEAVGTLVDSLDVTALLELYDEMAELTYGPMIEDPRRECSYASVMYTRDLVRPWIEGRGEALRTSWGL
ncbi:CotH kinase family protein [Myxococcota bacterium]|nr:CotH kinase family protein [Myxococcota bacterium]